MKHLLLTTIAAVVLVGCGESQQSAPAPEVKPVEPVAEAAKPEPPTAKAVSANKGADPARGIKPEPMTAKVPVISIHDAAAKGNIEAVKHHLAAGVDVNAKNWGGKTPLRWSALDSRQQVAQINVSDIGAVLFLIALVLCPIIFFAGIIALIIWAVKKGKGSGKGGSNYDSGYYGNSCSSDSSSNDSSSSCGSSCGGCGGGD